MRVTITDIAKRAGVSKSTVSLVLQGSTLIKPGTAEKVRKAAARLGYVYNRSAAQLRGQVSNVIGVLINDLRNPFFAELFVGLERRLTAAGYVCLMAHSDERVDSQERILESMREHRAAGLVICPAFGSNASFLTRIKRFGIPLLVLVRSLGNGRYDFVGADNRAGFRAGAEHLIALGHRRIALLGPANAGYPYDERARGFAQALQSHRIALKRSWLIDVPATRNGGRDGVEAALSLRQPVTAALCYNDVVAFGALATLGAHGMQPGRDFSIVGFDGVVAAGHSNPPLTTLEVDPSALGERAADVLLHRIQHPSAAIQQLRLEPRLMVRRSSGPLLQVLSARNSIRRAS